MGKNDGFIIIPHCETCSEQCKKYIALCFMDSFKSGKSSLFCPKYKKIKEEKHEKEDIKTKKQKNKKGDLS